LPVPALQPAQRGELLREPASIPLPSIDDPFEPTEPAAEILLFLQNVRRADAP
jgi:hypothetical protein